ncbi:LCP family protein [uncultured Phascolarctobacterium sp.]|uniref:LCP family protein n=1 Tax=uncultured Phascolarctobacterium sp. TaxID=512296 RepID=UPI0026232CEC|nr:LCP family protein [uncultured Phascolarctobacterium sp.]
MKGILQAKILVAVAAVCAVIYMLAGYFFPEKGLDNLAPSDRLNLKKNIVVLGVDERAEEHDVGRSDTLFVVMFDTQKKSVSLLSVPRDTRVRIKGHGWDKINHAYAYGGRELTQKTVEELLGLHINNYVMVDFKGFTGLVDAIGGVDIDVEKDMYYHDTWDGFTVDLKKGKQHLDGKTAIQYVRYRDEEGDIGRIRRQQHFMMAVYERISSANMLLHVPGLAKQLSSMVKTDLPLSDLVDIGRALHAMVKTQGLAMATVPGEPVYIDDISYWVPDITDLREQIAKMQGAAMTERYKSAAELMEKEYNAALEKVEKGDDSDENKEAVKQEKDADKEQAAQEAKQDKDKPAVKKINSKKTPKAKTAVLQEGEQPAEAKKTAPRNGNVVRLVNCSGSKTAGADAISRLQNAGFTVINGGSGELIAQTTVISTTNNGAVIGRLSQVPFAHKLRVSRDGAADCGGVIMLGADYK